jgi:hypothetical protein
MLFKEIIPVYSENLMKHIKYKIQSYWSLKQVVNKLPLGFKVLNL